MIEDMFGNVVCFKFEDEGILMFIIYIFFLMLIFIKFFLRYLIFNNESYFFIISIFFNSNIY